MVLAPTPGNCRVCRHPYARNDPVSAANGGWAHDEPCAKHWRKDHAPAAPEGFEGQRRTIIRHVQRTTRRRAS